MNWNGKAVLVTGGASFIGSHLVDALIADGASVRIVDNLSSGKLANIQTHLNKQRVDFYQGDLLEPGVAAAMMRDIEVVFHLAAIHGGRGFIDANQARCSQNLAIDALTIKAATEAGVDRFVFASSGCVYPVSAQMDQTKAVFLTEDLVRPPFEADDTYGWAKLMAEIQLKAYHTDYGLKSAICRFFTVYGERCTENHAIMAIIGRAFLQQDPFEVWGDGTQVRNWTYVGDIVRGMIRSAEVITDGTAVNLGTEERIRVIDAVRAVLEYTGHQAEIKFLRDKPTGPLNRVASNQLARKLLGWKPEYDFITGLNKTIDWYFGEKNREQLAGEFENLLV